MKKITIVISFLLGVFTTVFILGPVTNATISGPISVYRTRIGSLENKEIADRAEQLYYAAKNVEELKHVTKHYNDQQAFFSAIFGGSNLVKLADKDWGDLDVEDWEEVMKLSHDLYFEDTDKIVADNVVNNDTFEKMEDITENLDKASMLWRNDSVSTTDDSTGSSPDVSQEVKTEKKEEKLTDMYQMQMLKYDDKILLPDGKEVDTSKSLGKHNKKNMDSWIKDTQQQLAKTENQFNRNLDQASVNANLQIQNKLLLILAQTQLRTLENLTDLNKMVLYTSMYHNYDQINQEEIDTKLREIE